jgi:hypothetical protein
LAFGAAGINSLIGHRIDELYISRRALEERLASSEKELAQLQQNLQDREHQRLASINVHVQIRNRNDLTKLEREQIELETVKYIKQRLVLFVGEELSVLNGRQIALIVDGRQVTFNEQKYVLKVDLVVVSEELDIYVNI